jgi:hypothetical protein
MCVMLSVRKVIAMNRANQFSIIAIATLIVFDGAVLPIQAQLSESDQTRMIKGLHISFELATMVQRVREGKVEANKLRAIETVLRNTNELSIHRMRGAKGNEVFLSPDGHQEAVYDHNHQLVRDGINNGTYNYFHPQKDPLRHFSFDIAPWLLLGQSPKDRTSHAERVNAYSADLFNGIIRTLEAPQASQELNKLDLKQAGSAEAVAIFLQATERGNADELLRVVIAGKKRDHRELAQLVRKFEVGLLKIIEAAPAN